MVYFLLAYVGLIADHIAALILMIKSSLDKEVLGRPEILLNALSNLSCLTSLFWSPCCLYFWQKTKWAWKWRVTHCFYLPLVLSVVVERLCQTSSFLQAWIDVHFCKKVWRDSGKVLGSEIRQFLKHVCAKYLYSCLKTISLNHILV